VEAPLTMLTDTYTASAFFVDFVADPKRALRWGSLRQDSGNPLAFVKEAKEAWREVEKRAGLLREDGIIANGKSVIFSDGLDVERAIKLQKGCDELGIAGKLFIPTDSRETLTGKLHLESAPS
jgi:nicotinate phosphoribosyltransferase